MMNAKSSASAKTSVTAQAKRQAPVKKFTVKISGGRTLTYIFRARPVISAMLAALVSSFMGYSYAQVMPTGGQTVAGTATISQTSANYMRIDQATNKAALNWESFSIGSGGHVQFFQPGASSVALNRVVGSSPSAIYGQLSANGQVFLINPHGTLFARGAQVDVGGLVASTLNISDADFMAGNYAFANDGSNGSVVNQGAINAGYAALLGPQVSNEGIIVARTGGTVALAAGDRVNLDLVGDGLISVNVDAAAVNANITNKGLIQADGGQVLLTARSANALLDTVINMDGVIKANSLVNRNGTIVLDGGDAGVVSVTGTLDASGKTPSPLAVTSDLATVSGQPSRMASSSIREGGGEGALSGGTVKVLGDKVGLFGVANINVSGDAGGGTALIGGNFQGKGPEQNATQTYVGSGATINADAISNGNGGKVIVWANDTTRYYGSISAKGGAQSGDGGFVEVSGKHALDFNGAVTTLAPNGRIGTLLLDPDYIIVATGGLQNLEGTAGGGNPNLLGFNEYTTAQTDTFTIAPLTLNGLAATVTLQAAIDLTITDAVNLTTAGAGFIGQAGNDIVLNNSITTNGGVITLTANDATSGVATGAGSITGGGALTSAGSAVTASAGGAITLSTSGTGTITVGAIDSHGGGGVALTAGGNGGLVSITTVDGNITTGTINTSGGNAGAATAGAAFAGGNAGGVTVQVTGATASRVLGLGAITATGGAGSTATVLDGAGGAGGTGGAVSVTGTAGAFGASLATAAINTSGGAGGDALDVGAAGGISGGAGGAAGAITLAVDQSIILGGAMTAAGGAGGAGTVTATDTSGSGGAGAAVSVTSNTASVSLGAITTTGGAAGTDNGGGAGTAGANATVTASAGTNLALNGAINAATSTIGFSVGQAGAGGTLNLAAAGALTGSTVTATGGAGSDAITGLGATTFNLTGANNAGTAGTTG
ncbi:MAG: filamentous hemagglutinin N-terminal domain-containing protein [Nitrosomonadales bacterium]|nr:filamentous hemagglutinin N-terminal domain-containing protein [Nitrosomonadales bacterium]